MTPDEELIQRSKQNDRKAQAEIFNKYSRKLYGLCLRYSKNADDAQDLLQDGFIKVFEKIDGYRGDSSLETWMTRLFLNLAITKIRQKKRQPGTVELYDDLSEETEEEFDDTLESQLFNDPSAGVERVLTLIQQLPDKYQMAINMYAIDGLSHKEIAELTGVSEGTSKSHLSRARKLLKDLIEKPRSA